MSELRQALHERDFWIRMHEEGMVRSKTIAVLCDKVEAPPDRPLLERVRWMAMACCVEERNREVLALRGVEEAAREFREAGKKGGHHRQEYYDALEAFDHALTALDEITGREDT